MFSGNSWRFLKSPAFCLRVDGRKRRFSNTMISYIISTTTILDKIDGEFRLSISSRIKDDKMARFGFCAASFLISGGGGGMVVCCSIFFCHGLLHNPHPARDGIIFPSLYRFHMDGQKQFKYAACGRVFEKGVRFRAWKRPIFTKIRHCRV